MQTLLKTSVVPRAAGLPLLGVMGLLLPCLLGCGQKGPLQLPASPAAPAATASAPAR